MRTRSWVLLLLLLAGLFAGLRGVAALEQPPDDSAIFTERVVVVGVTGRDQLSEVDRTVLGTHLDDAQAGTVSIRPRYVGDCAAAGWTTLGAGRRAGIASLCDPQVAGGVVTDWAAREAAAAADRGDAQLGTLAGSVDGCVSAIGAGAALAAATPEGSVPDYRTSADFAADGMSLSCPITLVDAGDGSDAVISHFAADRDVTVIVTGIGPPPGSHDPSLQVIYRLGTTLPGWLTSASTRRSGIVTLTDLTRTLIEFAPRSGTVPLTVDGSPFTVEQTSLTVDGIAAKIGAVSALSEAIPTAYLVMGLLGVAIIAVSAVLVRTRRRLAPLKIIVTCGAALPAAMQLTGAVPWAQSSSPGLSLCAAIIGWWLLVLAAIVLLGRRGLEVPMAAAAIAVAVFTVDAALGGPMQDGSLLNSRPIFGLRWYGFGNSTFAAYATTGLLLAGYLAHRLRTAERPRSALVAVAVIGFGVVICEGWPSMGSDFGGVVALTPPVLGLLLMLSGVRLTALRLLAVGGSAVVAITAISVLDWRRGPDRRSHLGNFVQRVIDGDAVDVVARKAAASAETVFSIPGLVSVLFGVAVWVLAFRFVAPTLAEDFVELRPTLVAIMATGILGTVLNDAGIYVWLIVSAVTSFAVGWWWLDHRDPPEPRWTVDWLRAARR